MTETRKSNRAKKAQAKRTANVRRTITGISLAATMAVAAPTFVAPLAFAITVENTAADVSYSNLTSPTLKDIVRTDVHGNVSLAIEAYRQEGSNQNISSVVVPKRIVKDAAAEKQAWDEAAADEQSFRNNIFDPISKEQGRWDSGSLGDIGWSEDRTERVITFRSDGTTRTYPSLEAIIEARNASQANWDWATTELNRLDDIENKKEVAYYTAVAPVDSKTEYSLSLTAEGSDYESKDFVLEPGVLEDEHFTAAVVSNEAGTLRLDITFNTPLEATVVATVNYINVAAPVAPTPTPTPVEEAPSPTPVEETPWVATVPTDTSKIDMSDPSNHHRVIPTDSSFLDKKAVKERRYNKTNRLFSATTPEAMDVVAILTVNEKVAVPVLANANAGITLVDTFNTRSSDPAFDPKAQDRLIEDSSLQAVNDATGEVISMNESTVIKGVGKISVIPATGNSDAVPVTYENGVAKPAENKYDRPYVTFTPEKGYMGEVPSFSVRWKTVAYGDKTADMKGFWAAYDTNGTGSELVETSKIHLRYDAPDLTDSAASGRARAMNPQWTTPSATFDRNNYAHMESTSGGGGKPILVGYGAKDGVHVATDTATSVDVTANDAVANNGFMEFIGGPYYGQKEYGFKAEDGSLVKELAVEGGKWVTYTEDVENGEYSHANVYGRFVAGEGVTTVPDVVWVNKNEMGSAEGRVLKASVSKSKYKYVSSTLRLIDASGNLVEDLTVAEVGTWKVNPQNANIVFTPVSTYEGTAEVKYSVVDRWVGSTADQSHDLYEYAMKPYGAETIGIMAVTVGDEVPEKTPEETTPEETPEETPVIDETPDPEIPPVKDETPGDTPEEVPTLDESPGPDSSEEKENEPEGEDPQLTTISEDPTPSKEPDFGTSTTVETPQKTAGSSYKESDPLAETGHPIPMTLLGGGLLTALGGLVFGRRIKAKH